MPFRSDQAIDAERPERDVLERDVLERDVLEREPFRRAWWSDRPGARAPS